MDEVRLVGFYGKSTIVGNLMPNPVSSLYRCIVNMICKRLVCS